MSPKSIFSFVKRKAYNFATDIYSQQWERRVMEQRAVNENKIPKYDLEQRHIQNLTVLLNRDELLKNLPSNAICAEIGVNEGEFSEAILTITKPERLHLIDAWGDAERYHDGLKEVVKEKFRKEINSKQVEINVGFSTDVLKNFPDRYFDWVYLDSDHTYSVTAAELSILKNKVKSNGIIAGHDYIIGNWVGDCRYGVIEAVHELCINDDWELLFITINKNEMPSFAIRKLQ